MLESVLASTFSPEMPTLVLCFFDMTKERLNSAS